MNTTTSGIDSDALFIGLGATWRYTDSLDVGLHWRADFRTDADMENQLGLSTGYRF